MPRPELCRHCLAALSPTGKATLRKTAKAGRNAECVYSRGVCRNHFEFYRRRIRRKALVDVDGKSVVLTDALAVKLGLLDPLPPRLALSNPLRSRKS